MIAKLRGTIDTIKATEIILDVQGVGYLLQIPLSTYESIQGEKEISLHVYTLHKEDQLRLFGFSTAKERELFSMLLQTSGIGPAMALSLLSGITVEGLVDAVQNENSALLVKIPGIGKSKAEKLIFELKRKLTKLELFASAGGGSPAAGAPVTGEAVEALASLGFDATKAAKAVDTIRKEKPEAPLEEVIKEALKLFSL